MARHWQWHWRCISHLVRVRRRQPWRKWRDCFDFRGSSGKKSRETSSYGTRQCIISIFRLFLFSLTAVTCCALLAHVCRSLCGSVRRTVYLTCTWNLSYDRTSYDNCGPTSVSVQTLVAASSPVLPVPLQWCQLSTDAVLFGVRSSLVQRRSWSYWSQRVKLMHRRRGCRSAICYTSLCWGTVLLELYIDCQNYAVFGWNQTHKEIAIMQQKLVKFVRSFTRMDNRANETSIVTCHTVRYQPVCILCQRNMKDWLQLINEAN